MIFGMNNITSDFGKLMQTNLLDVELWMNHQDIYKQCYTQFQLPNIEYAFDIRIRRIAAIHKVSLSKSYY